MEHAFGSKVLRIIMIMILQYTKTYRYVLVTIRESDQEYINVIIGMTPIWPKPVGP